MANLILLSTFVLRLREKRSLEHAFLSRFNNPNHDFIQVFEEFLNYRIGNHYRGPKDKQGRRKSLYCRTDNLRWIDERTLHGFVYSGLSGEKGDVVNDRTGEDLYTMEDDHAKILPTYFFLHIPKNRKDAYLILQKKSNYGIKNLFEDAFADYFNNLNINFILEVNNFLVSLVFEKMLKVGRIFEMSFVKNAIEDDVADLYDKDARNKRIPGKTVTKITTKSGFPVSGLLRRLYFGSTKDGMIEIPELHDRFDEVDFDMDYNGSKKTFHMKNVGRTTPDFNVTDQIELIDNLPTYESLEAQCQILLKDMKEYHEAKLQ